MNESAVPARYEQAVERAHEEMSLTELCNMVLDLPGVSYVQPEGVNVDWRPVTVSVSFKDRHGTGTSSVITIFRRQGWKIAGVTFSLNRITFKNDTEDTEPAYSNV